MQWLSIILSQAELLERDVLEVMALARSMKNTFVPINRISPEVLSLIARYCEKDGDQVTLTHVCRRWREIFISHSPSWTSLDCTNVDKTRVYLERSKASPLEIRIVDYSSLYNAFLLTVPHLGRLGSLSLFASSENFPEFTKHLSSPTPLLKNLTLVVTDREATTLQDTTFDGDLPSLRGLYLNRVTTSLAWKNMSNLRTFVLRDVPSDKISVNQLLRFFERAPLLRRITLQRAFPVSSDAPPGQVVPLPNLKFLDISAKQSHTILIDHLSFPTGALITQDFTFSGPDSPIPFHLPRTFKNLKNLSNISSINLNFNLGINLRLRGSSGGLCMRGSRSGQGVAPNLWDLQSLKKFRISEVERLAISQWSHTIPRQGTTEDPIFQTFLLMENLRTLTLTCCVNSSFFIALNPKENDSRTLICPRLQELSVYSEKTDWFGSREQMEMAKERASGGAGLKTITIVGPHELVAAEEVFVLQAFGLHVECRVDDTPPEWDAIPGVSDDNGYESDE